MSLEKIKNPFLLFLTLTGCASAPPSPTSAPTPTPNTDPLTTLQEQVSKLQDKTQDLETRLNALNEKINIQNGAAPPPPPKPDEDPGMKTEIVQSRPSDINPTRAKTKANPHDAKKSEQLIFSNEVVDRFREAKILYDSKRYADSMLEFSDFVKNEPDHVLASGAQYYVGMSYLKQKEYKLAEEELSRGLLAYPHSSFTPDYLLSLAEVSSALNKPDREIYFKQKLLAYFPTSPQAKNINLEKPKGKEKIKSPDLPATPVSPESPIEPSVVGGES